MKGIGDANTKVGDGTWGVTHVEETGRVTGCLLYN